MKESKANRHSQIGPMSKHGTEKSKQQLQEYMKEHMENEPNGAASLIQNQKLSQFNIESKYGTERSNFK